VFCQNWQISQQPESLATVQTFTPEQLGQAMIELQTQGAHNINWVSPTPWTPQLLESLLWARDHGLTLPIVYNSNGYDSLEALRGMDGAVDIYLPDLKYGEDHHAQSFSHAKGYVQASHTAINEMFRQVGLLQLDENDIATSGLIVRHLVLPSDSLATPSPSGLRPSPSPNKGEGDVSRSRTSLSPFGRGTEGEGVETPVHYSANPPSPLQFLASLDPNIHISLMSQYSPQYKAKDTPPLDQPLSMDDYDVAVAEAESLGLENVWIQEMESQTVFVPDFESERPFDGTPFLSKNSF
jgi:putative pyruvate formate lyase activating enzyme